MNKILKALTRKATNYIESVIGHLFFAGSNINWPIVDDDPYFSCFCLRNHSNVHPAIPDKISSKIFVKKKISPIDILEKNY
jgi:hypothetical protein